MMDFSDKIIVFDSYDTVMAANLVKTKLDAYGIPCFLTDENFVGLYPIRNELFPGVRLHIFEKDKEQVSELLKEDSSGEKENSQCPSCGSKNILPKEITQSGFERILSTMFVSPFMVEKRTYCCKDCAHEFNSGATN